MLFGLQSPFAKVIRPTSRGLKLVPMIPAYCILIVCFSKTFLGNTSVSLYRSLTNDVHCQVRTEPGTGCIQIKGLTETPKKAEISAVQDEVTVEEFKATWLTSFHVRDRTETMSST